MRTDVARPLAIFLCLAAGRVAAADWHVWTVTETRHVLRSEPAADGLAVKVAGARNEWVSFQILVRSDEPIKAIRLESGELQGPEGAVLRTSESRLYRQHQLHLEIGTYRNDAFKPDWYPDPLIPFERPAGGKELENPHLVAAPFDLPADETHGFWVDLHVPADTPAGDYRGTYHVNAEGGKSLEVPVMLTVWDFTLPQTPTLVTAFGSPAQRMRDYTQQRAKANGEPEPSDWEAAETQCAQLLSEHRFDATPPAEMLRPVAQADGSFQIPSRQIQALRRFVDRYHVNALQIPHPSGVVKDPQAERDKLRAWLGAFDRASKELDRPQVVFFVYLRDEPNTREDYEYVQKWGRAIREAKSVVQVMVVEQTWTEPGKGGADSAWGDLYGAVDIWCPLFSLHHQDSAAKRQALGETVWAYTALCQGPPTPWWHIDYPLLNYRVPAWMAWRDRMKGLLYWGGMSYWRETDDSWLHAPVYTGRGAPQQGDKGIRFNGEGSLVYPVRQAGYDGIVPTIRLKALRDAIEDYEYLVMLDRLGKSAEADRIVRRLTESWFQWDKDPAAYEKARAEIAAMIVAANPTSRRAVPAAADGALYPWSSNTHPTDVAKSHVEEITAGVGTTHKYTVFQGGSMDGRNCRSPMGCGIAREGALLQTWESNRSVRMENVGDDDIVNPWLSNGRNNFRSVEEIVSSAVAPGMTDADKAFALWFQEIQYRHHSGGDNNELGDPVKVFNVYGYNTCGNDSISLATLWRKAGLRAAPARALGHCISQAFYDGGWHFYDGDMHSVYLLRDNQTVAGEQDIVRDHDLIKRTHSKGILFPDAWWSDPEMCAMYFFEGPVTGERSGKSDTTMNMVLRPGEALVWRWGQVRPLKYHGMLYSTPTYEDAIYNGLWEYRPDFSKATWRNGAAAVEDITRRVQISSDHNCICQLALRRPMTKALARRPSVQ